MDRFAIHGNGPQIVPPSVEKSQDKGFGQRLKRAVETVNDFQQEADSATEQVIKGTLGVHEGMLALSKADISLRLLLQVRNKVLEAYREITRMGF